MDTERIILITIFIGLPSIGFPFIISYLRSDRFKETIPNSLYRLSVLGHSIVLSKHLIIQLCCLLFLYSWLDMVFPLPFILFFLVIAFVSLKLAEAEPIDDTYLSDSNKKLVDRLNDMQSEIGDITNHLEGLGQHLVTKQTELNEKVKTRRALEREIEEKSSEASHWKSLTKKQKELVLDSAVEAMSRKSKGTFWLGLLFGFFVNIFATLTWTMLGNPGKQQILEKTNNIINLLS